MEIPCKIIETCETTLHISSGKKKCLEKSINFSEICENTPCISYVKKKVSIKSVKSVKLAKSVKALPISLLVKKSFGKSVKS